VQVNRAHDYAKYVGGNESELIGSEADDAHHYTIDAGKCPAFAASPPNQNRGRDG